MTTQAIKSQGVQLKRGDGATPTEAFTLVAEITQFTGPQQTAKAIPATSLDSTSHEYIPGLRDGGQLAFDCNYVPGDAGQQGVLADLAAGTKRNYQLLLTDQATPTKITFATVVTSHVIKGQVDDKVMASMSLKISGVPVYTYGTP